MLRGSFAPPMIANLAVWLDAADVSRMFQLANGTTAVAASGDPVGYVGAYVGGNAVQATNNNRPTWQAGAQNGLPVLRFDGTNDSLQIASVALQSHFAIFVAGKFTTTKPLFVEHSGNANVTSGFYFYGANLYSLRIFRALGQFDRNASSSTWAGSGFVVLDAQHAGNTDVAIAKNGTAEVLNQNNGAANSNLADSSVTTSLNICSRNQSSIFSDGDLGELIIYNRRITASECVAVRRYLGRKWGVAVA